MTDKEMKLFLGVNFIMSHVNSQYRMYWLSLNTLRMDTIANVLSMKRFKKYIHFKNNDLLTVDNKDIFIKIQQLLDMMNNRFSYVRPHNKFISINEMLNSFKRQLKI